MILQLVWLTHFPSLERVVKLILKKGFLSRISVYFYWMKPLAIVLISHTFKHVSEYKLRTHVIGRII